MKPTRWNTCRKKNSMPANSSKRNIYKVHLEYAEKQEILKVTHMTHKYNRWSLIRWFSYLSNLIMQEKVWILNIILGHLELKNQFD